MKRKLQKKDKIKSEQKKNEDMSRSKLFVVITFKLTSDPNKYAPPSPKKIFADGKLNRRKVIKTII